MAQNVSRRKLIEEMIPEGTIVTRQWITDKLSLDKHAIDNFVKSEQLNSISRGVYTRGKGKITWQSVVFTLQYRMKSDLVVGGLSALEIKGFSHYIPQSMHQIIHLYGNDKLPNWINNISKNFIFRYHGQKELFSSISQNDSEKYLTGNFWKEDMEELKITVPERACLEMLNEVPHKISFEHASQLIQGMTTLSPRVLQKLLEDCTNIKVKRLFLWFGKKNNYTWFSRIDETKIDLGSGNRVIVKGGELDKSYKITVPRNFEN